MNYGPPRWCRYGLDCRNGACAFAHPSAARTPAQSWPPNHFDQSMPQQSTNFGRSMASMASQQAQTPSQPVQPWPPNHFDQSTAQQLSRFDHPMASRQTQQMSQPPAAPPRAHQDLGHTATPGHSSQSTASTAVPPYRSAIYKVHGLDGDVVYLQGPYERDRFPVVKPAHGLHVGFKVIVSFRYDGQISAVERFESEYAVVQISPECARQGLGLFCIGGYFRHHVPSRIQYLIDNRTPWLTIEWMSSEQEARQFCQAPSL